MRDRDSAGHNPVVGNRSGHAGPDNRTTAVETIQRCYPQIYFACHVRHVRASSTPHRLSAKDSSLLVHLSPASPVTPGELAMHVGVGASTLSAAIHRLAALGYLRHDQDSKDRRVAALTLTQKGARAMAATSVLDPARVAAVLAKLKPGERQCALKGIELLAWASRAVSQEAQAAKKKRGG